MPLIGGGEAEIVFDPRRGAGLAADGRRSGIRKASPFRCRIDRGRETGRAGPDDGHVVEGVRIDRPDQPDAAGEFGSLGLRSGCPLGHSAIGNSPGSTWKRAISAFAAGSVSKSSRWHG